ncbi:histone-lysine N-methyltransferase SUV39H2 [Lampetra fluviatilis]
MELGPKRDIFVPCLVSLDRLSEICRQQKLKCADLDITRHNINYYEVEYLCNYQKKEDMEFYLVKWKGYPESENSWLSRKDLKCKDLLNVFHKDMERESKRQKQVKIVNGKKPRKNVRNLDPTVAEYLKLKGQQRLRLAAWQKDLNRKKNHSALILVENDVDLEGPPASFIYINEYRPMDGVVMAKEPVVGCSCKDCFSERGNGCCPTINFTSFAYTNSGRVKVKPGTPIYECNSLCQCGPECKNRVVQKGIPFPLCIFRTDNGRGWGVKTMQKIKKNSFVMEYVGELIPSEEAERRGVIYDRAGTTYLFDLDFCNDDYTVDATFYGNISHFVNHSCEPNLQVYSTFINNHDFSQPRIAFFAMDDLAAGEELTFDYNIKEMTEDVADTSNSLIQASPLSSHKCQDSSSRALHGQVTNGPVAIASYSIAPDSIGSVPNGNIVNGQVLNTPISNGLVPNGLVKNDLISNSSSQNESCNKDTALHTTVTTSPKKRARITCKCGASTCRKFLY